MSLNLIKMLFEEGFRRHFKALLKNITEIALRVKAAPLGNVDDRHIAGGQQALSRRKPCSGDKLVGRKVGHLREDAVKIGRAQMAPFGQNLGIQGLGIMLTDIFHRGLDRRLACVGRCIVRGADGSVLS